MILSDRDIKKAMKLGKLLITGFEELYIGPSSVDLHLSRKAKRLKNNTDLLDQKFNNGDKFSDVVDDEFIISPGQFWLMSTIETISFPNGVCGFVQGRSSIGRLGLQIHCAGFVDAGFKGQITLEVTNVTSVPIRIYAGSRICQMVFVETKTVAEIGYADKKDQKYSGQVGPTVTKSQEDK